VSEIGPDDTFLMPVGTGRHRQVVDGALPAAGFLRAPDATPAVDRLYAHDLAEMGYVMNLSRAWAHLPPAHEGLVALLGQAAAAAGLTFRQRGVLVSAAASTMGDPHCSLAWGGRLAGEVGEEVAARVLRGDDSGLSEPEQALASWARSLAVDPNGTDSGDVQALRDAGYDDAQIFAITLYVALRIAFSTVNDALGARPDRELGRTVPALVREAVIFGRPPDEGGPAAGD
jgi:alkylhydroperoxidase family enzyme